MRTKIVLRADDTVDLIDTLNKNLSGLKCKIKRLTLACECTFEEDIRVRDAIIRSVREYIVNNCEEKEICRIINREYSGMSFNDKNLLKDSVKKAIDSEEDIHEQLFVIRRNRIIEMTANKYFNENSTLNLNGFIPFWLKNYKAELQHLVDYSADEFAIKKEYEEFICLLKEYLCYKPQKIKCLNVLAKKNGRFEYYLPEGENITEGLEQSCYIEAGEDSSQEDILTCILINNNPGRIVIHNKKYMRKEILKTIKNIFGKRCIECLGCSKCTDFPMQ